MKGFMKLKRLIIWFLIFTFLNSVIMHNFVAAETVPAYNRGSAASTFDEFMEEAEEEQYETMLIGSLIVLGSLLLLFVIVKEVTSDNSNTPERDKSSEELQASEEQNTFISISEEEIVAPDGMFVVYKW